MPKYPLIFIERTKIIHEKNNNKYDMNTGVVKARFVKPSHE